MKFCAENADKGTIYNVFDHMRNLRYMLRDQLTCYLLIIAL